MDENFKTIGFKLNNESNVIHYLFFQEYKLNADLIAASTESKLNEYVSSILFVKNIPPYLEENHIKSIFNCYGKIDYILFNLKPTPKNFQTFLAEQANIKSNIKNYFRKNDSENDYCYKECYVFFNQSQAIEKAMATQKNERIATLGSITQTGVKNWVDEYKSSFIDARILQKEIDNYMEQYDKNKEIKEQEELNATNQVDEDGWITVTPKNRKANLRFTQRNIQKINMKQKKKQQQMQLVNFYKFQMRDSQKDYVNQLRKKFEEDKKRIESMKQTRKFKPF